MNRDALKEVIHHFRSSPRGKQAWLEWAKVAVPTTKDVGPGSVHISEEQLKDFARLHWGNSAGRV